MKINLDLQFKGVRNYLHGSDLYDHSQNSMREMLGDGFIKKIAFRGFAKTKSFLIVNHSPPLSYFGEGEFQMSDKSLVKFWLCETGEEVTFRYQFDEDGIITLASINLSTRSIMLSNRSQYLPIEEIIALTKAINYKITPTIKGKWVFAQLELNQCLPYEFTSLEIKIKSLIPARFSVNQIIIDGKLLGQINFSVGNP